MEPTHRFLRACLKLPVDRTPVWMMRQAGRYLPEYRAVRSKTNFLGLLKAPDLACEVTLQPIDIFGFDAAILFSDILVPLEAMGIPLTFETGEGPKLEPVRDAAAVAKLIHPDPEQTMPFVYEAIRKIKVALAGRVPLIGFAGAPFTLASYAVEGGTSKNFTVLKRLLYAAPDTARALFTKIAEVLVTYCEAQLAAGAEALQLFDTWAGILAPPDFEPWALSWAKRVFDGIRATKTFQARPVPLIYYVNGSAPYLEQVKTLGVDVMGIDWKQDLGDARRRLGPQIGVQGNLDPTLLFLPAAQIEQRVKQILDAGKVHPTGHVFNLGHGILPETPVDGVRAMLAAVHEHG